MAEIQSVKGTRDFFPKEMAFRSWLLANIKRVSDSFGYQQFDGPFLESIDLYAAKSGAELVEEQAYVFKDKGGARIALRPELTPSLARMVAQRVRAMPLPIRWWSFGPFWRYERPQKGRTREFFQWNIDLLGIDSAEADAEIATIAARFLEAVGLPPESVQIRVNNRRLVEQQLAEIGLDKPAYDDVFRLIDRREKMTQQEWTGYAASLGIDKPQIDGIQAMLEDDQAWRSSDELAAFFHAGDTMGFNGYVRYDPTIVRGLDYYTGTVFEARDTAGEQRAILGGGRYDNLVAAVGGDPVPGVGFAMGDVVLELVLRESDRFPELRPSPANLLVANFTEETQEQAIDLARRLRAQGICVEWYPQPGGLGKQFRYADRYGIPFVAVLGPDEIADGTVSIKSLASGDQEQVPIDDAADYLRAQLHID